MATSPLGGFADLSGARRLADAQKARNVSGLENLIQNYIGGAQQGNVLVNLPEILQQENQARNVKALADQIALQLQGVQLAEAQNPNLALERALRLKLAQESATPGTGIVVSPVGLEGQTIATPGALTDQQMGILGIQDELAARGGAPVEIPTAPVGAPITPIVGIGGAPTGFSQDLNQAIAESALMSRAKGANTADIAAQRNDAFLQGLQARKALEDEKIASREKIAADRLATQGSKSVLALNENGVLTNMVLGPNEALPEGFKKYERPSSLATSDPLKFYQAVKKDPVVKDYLDIVPQYARMKSALEESKKGGSLVAVDQALINTFNRILDPQSVVRESEYARTAQDQSVLDFLKGKFDPKTGKLVVGGAGLTPENREAMLRMADRFYSSSLQNYNHAVREFETLAEMKGLDVNAVIPRAVSVETLTTSSPRSTAPVTVTTPQEYQALPSGTEYIGPDGKRARKK